MTPHPANVFFLNTVLLGGTTIEKLDAAQKAGFDEVELWHRDLDAFEGSSASFVKSLRQHSLGVTDLQVLLDFDGAPDATRASKRTEALQLLTSAAAIGATTVLVPASTDPDCVPSRILDDLRWLCAQAAARSLRVAYENLAWSSVNFALPSIWETVQRVGAPNFGLVIDAFHIFVRGRDASDLDGIPMEKIFAVQLSDLDDRLVTRENLVETARHHRRLPGRGIFPVGTILERLIESGYAGPVGIEVFNDTMKASDPAAVAVDSMEALRQVWGAAQVAVSSRRAAGIAVGIGEELEGRRPAA